MRGRTPARVQVAEIHSILDAANVDYRDCLEKAELLQRLQAAERVLPSQAKVRVAERPVLSAAILLGHPPRAAVPQARLQYLLHRQSAPSTADAAAPPLASAALFEDEQYVVQLFKVGLRLPVRCCTCHARMRCRTDPPRHVQEAKASVVRINTVRPGAQSLFSPSGGGGPGGAGSGFVWDEDGHVITNYHARPSSHAPSWPPASRQLQGCAAQPID